MPAKLSKVQRIVAARSWVRGRIDFYRDEGEDLTRRRDILGHARYTTLYMANAEHFFRYVFVAKRLWDRLGG